jgi:hypothetical protein
MPVPRLEEAELDRFCAPTILGDRAGLERLSQQKNVAAEIVELADLTRCPAKRPTIPETLEGRIGVWIHPDDLLIERSALASLSPVAVAGFLARDVMDEFGYGMTRREFEIMALEDGVERAGAHFGCDARALEVAALPGAFGTWVAEHRLDHVVAVAPFIGEWADQLQSVRAEARRVGAELHLCRRPTDGDLLSDARDKHAGADEPFTIEL